MLTNILSKPMEIVIGEQTHKFNSLADFELSLTGRTSVPVDKFKNALNDVNKSLVEFRKINIEDYRLKEFQNLDEIILEIINYKKIMYIIIMKRFLQII